MGDKVTGSRNRPACVRREAPTALTAAKRQHFLDVLAATANVRRAAQEAGAACPSFYKLRRRDAAFAAAWEESLNDSYAMLETKLIERALGTGEQEAGDADRAGVTDAFDPELAVTMVKLRDARNKAPSRRVRASGYKQVTIEEVERSLLRKLEALRRRLLHIGVELAELPG